MNAVTGAAYLTLRSLGRRGVCQTRVPADGNSNRAAVIEIDGQRIVCDVTVTSLDMRLPTSSCEMPSPSRQVGFDLWKASTPFIGIAGRMEHAMNGYPAFHMIVEDGVGKAAHQRPTIIVERDGVHPGSAAYRLNTGIDGGKEVLSQAGAAFFIPGVRPCEVLPNLRREVWIRGRNGCGPGV